MIGAMPAVAVRHERRRQEKRNKRPSLLYLQSPHSRSATPSPLQSPPASHQFPPEIYVCGKVSVLHIVVVSLLLGAVLLIVGLVQLKPGADASQHRYVLLGSGAFLLVVGVALAVVRCCLLPWKSRQDQGQQQVAIEGAHGHAHTAQQNYATTEHRRSSVSHKRGSMTVRGNSSEFDSLPQGAPPPHPPAKVHETSETSRRVSS
ncbi:Hypothetical protein NTJ_15000 [Nesidiocoris tenuis]|uniref:Uncharacterized protein n=1 Tax=Nesidiocoris tenuis TaxID=355587 RepID=A0ABN7BG50_9HEMI|nr:Hypothetical protein NTJ_15000 [Nesidiocoris tenuis]